MSTPSNTPLPPEVRRALAAFKTEEGAPVDDAQLIAFRAGSLSPQAHEATAQAIAAHPESRALLRALAADPPRAEDQAWMAGMRATRGRRRARAAGWIGAAFAVAAVLLAVMLRADLSPPSYALEGPFGGVADARGEHAQASAVFAPTSRLRVLARPMPDATPATACVAYLRSADDAPQRVPQDAITFASSGVCRLEADVARLATTPGDYTVVLILGGTPAPDLDAPWPGWDATGARVLSAPFTLRPKATP